MFSRVGYRVAQHVVFLCVASLRVIYILRFINLACISGLFLFVAELYSTVWICYNLSSHLLVDLWVVPVFPLQMELLWTFFAWTYMIVSLSGMAGSGKDVYNVIRNCPTIFQSGCNILHFRQRCVWVLVAPRPHHHLLLSGFLVLALRMRLYGYVILVLILISLMTKGVEHLIGLWAICRSAFVCF